MVKFNNINLLFTNGITGSTGTTITPTSVTTPSISTQSLILSSGTGLSGTILSTNGTNLVWISPSASENIRSSNLDMQTNNITNANTISCTTLNATSIVGPTTIVNPVTFANPPTSITPSKLNELTTKSYVDNLASNFYNLYLNKSITSSVSATYYTLSNTPTTATNQTIPTTISSNGFPGVSIGSFLSDPIGITQLPTSLWCLNIWGTISSLTDATNYYAKFSLYINDTTITPIGTSTNSTNHIALTSTTIPYNYTVNFTLSSTRTTNTTDRILIELFAYKVSGTTTQTVTTYFETPYYSYSQLQISNPISALSFIWSSSVNSNLNMNSFNITSTGNLDISCPNKILSFDKTGNTGINIGTDTTVPTVINLLSTGSTGSIYMIKPTVINYTNSPSTGQIGEIINVTLLATPSFNSSGTEVEVASKLLNPGVWLVTASSGFYYIQVGTDITRMAIYIKNGETFICQHENNGLSAVTSGHILSCAGIIGITTQSTIKLYQAMTYSGGAYRVADASTNFMFQFVRIA